MAGSRLGKFLRLPAPDRSLLLRSVFTLAAARIALRVLPFKSVRRWVTPRPRREPSTVITPERVGWAIGLAQRVIPDATCLPQAVAAESLLTRAGHPVQLHLGVMKTPAGAFEAHAWVMSGGRIVVGQLPGGLGDYTPLPPLPPVWPDSGSATSP